MSVKIIRNRKISDLSDAELLKLIYEIWKEKKNPLTNLLYANVLVEELKKRGFDVSIEELYDRLMKIMTKVASNPRYLIELAETTSIREISNFVLASGKGSKDFSIYFRVPEEKGKEILAITVQMIPKTKTSISSEVDEIFKEAFEIFPDLRKFVNEHAKEVYTRLVNHVYSLIKDRKLSKCSDFEDCVLRDFIYFVIIRNPDYKNWITLEDGKLARHTKLRFVQVATFFSKLFEELERIPLENWLRKVENLLKQKEFLGAITYLAGLLNTSIESVPDILHAILVENKLRLFS